MIERDGPVIKIRGKKLADMTREEAIATVQFLAEILLDRHLAQPANREEPKAEPPQRGPRQQSLF